MTTQEAGPFGAREAMGSPEAGSRLPLLLAALEAEGEARMTVAASEEDLARLENAIGGPLPPDLRRLLRSLGPGLYDRGHEIFGPSRVMIHDIEIVPDMLSVRARLAAEGPLEPHLVPFHRDRALIHLIRTREPRRGEIVSRPEGNTYPDLATFLERVMAWPTATGH